MLVASSMGSHGGQQNLPFGYDLDNLHGIGLPNFMSPGPPPGQPLLNEHDNQTLNSFFSGFEAGGEVGKQGHAQHMSQDVNQEQEWMMPPTFVGSETSFRGRAGIDWQNAAQNDFTFGNDMSQMAHNGAFGNLQPNHFPVTQFDGSMLHHIHSVAHGEMVDPNFGPASWQQSFHDHNASHMSQKPPMRFGSDQHFQPGGYAAPEGQFEPAAPSLDWLEPHSSATNTQPNTRPNTQPSSPVWTKKRKLDDFQTPQIITNDKLNVSAQSTPPVPRQHSSRRKDQAPLTPASGQPSVGKHEDELSDAKYDEEDEDDQRSPGSGTWPVSRSKSSKTRSSPSNNARSRRKSVTVNTPVKLKSKTSRSSGAAAVSANATRVPLTADQKKANHTNSEQRRRDATAKAYAELYDLIPELNDLGKQSTMKKLEIVVAKVAQVKERVAQLRAILGPDLENGSLTDRSAYHNHGAAGMTNMFNAGTSWQQHQNGEP